MRQVWRVADVRAAEAGLMATLPPGTLMGRAAAGLARRCALLLTDRFAAPPGRGPASTSPPWAATRSRMPIRPSPAPAAGAPPCPSSLTSISSSLAR